MESKEKTETIIEPNDHILRIQQEYIEKIQQLLPEAHIEIVGSMAIPMAGRSELDILVISKDIETDSKKIEDTGFLYRTLADNAYYLKKKVEGVDVTVHVMFKDNKMITIYRKMIELLRSDDILRKRYEEFKWTLNGLARSEYKKKKVDWMKENILPKLEE